MHIALGLGLVAPPRSPLRPTTDVRGLARVFAGGLAAFAVFLAFAPAQRLIIQLTLTVLGEPIDHAQVAAAAPVLLCSAVALLVAAGLWLVDGPLAGLVARGWLGGALRRARAYWADPRRVDGPADVYARLLDQGPGLRLDDVEGFVAWADRSQWPLRWRVLRAWVRAEQSRLDQAVCAGDEVLVVGGQSVPTMEAADRLQRVARALWPR